MGWRWVLLLLLATRPAYAGDLPPVVLGLVVPGPGEADAVAQHMRRAADLAASTWAPRVGRRIEIRVADDMFDPRHAAATADRLVREGAWGVVGHYYSSSSLAASVVYHGAGVPQVTATATHPRLTAQGFSTVFRVCGRDDQQAVVAAEYVLTRLQARRIGLVHDRTEYGRGLIEVFKGEVMRRAPRRIVAEESLAQGDRDFASQVRRLGAARPTAVYFGGVFREAAHLVRQLRQAGVDAAFVGGDAVLDPEFIRLAGEDAALPTYLTLPPAPRLSVSARPLIERYEARYGRFDPSVLYTYDAVGALLHAIHLARPAGPRPADLRTVAGIIHDRPYDGAAGTLRWDRNGDVVPAPYALYAVKRGGSAREGLEQVFPGREGAGAPGARERGREGPPRCCDAVVPAERGDAP